MPSSLLSSTAPSTRRYSLSAPSPPPDVARDVVALSSGRRGRSILLSCHGTVILPSQPWCTAELQSGDVAGSSRGRGKDANLLWICRGGAGGGTAELEWRCGTAERKQRLSAEQVVALEQSFDEEKRKLEPERKIKLPRRLGMAPRKVAVWFQNGRARWNANQLAGRDVLLADNGRLRS
ncbi:hypothetical protein QYE76_053832 [Lolium multiflorum]|uniref:Homeobox-leucine zipper protein n=1 Tax=Lolium multiflorum TaxID=4521 RepID=A0AAD8SYA0_LOLMU|nr:hypothetical protein QYE76_053832 [Lolium multiflorum]